MRIPFRSGEVAGGDRPIEVVLYSMLCPIKVRSALLQKSPMLQLLVRAHANTRGIESSNSAAEVEAAAVPPPNFSSPA